MHENIQLIRIKVDRPAILEHIGGPSPTICGLFLSTNMFTVASTVELPLVKSTEKILDYRNVIRGIMKTRDTEAKPKTKGC